MRVKTHECRGLRWLTPVLSVCCALSVCRAGPAEKGARATLVETFTLPRLSLSRFGNPECTEASLARAVTHGLKFTDLPSIGSGLARTGENEFVGITDRGPNGTGGDDDGVHRTFPLPEFCPTIVRFKLLGGKIRITEFIPIRDAQGRRISGLSNVEGEERLYESPGAAAPLALDENGIDPEAIRVLPDGKFLVSEEYSPSVLVIATNGQVLVRYTPASKRLSHAAYPVRPILPDVFARRRANKGFENLALSPDGRTAFALLQSPMGEDPRLGSSRIIRGVKLDVSNPLAARVAGEYLFEESDARDDSAKERQSRVSWSDAECIAPGRLLVLERAKGQVKLLDVNLSGATDILNHPDEPGLKLEDPSTDLAALKIAPARGRAIFSTREVPGITSDKLEGLAVLNPTEIALSNDNDFGIGENETGEPSMVWIVRLSEPLPGGHGD